MSRRMRETRFGARGTIDYSNIRERDDPRSAHFGDEGRPRNCILSEWEKAADGRCPSFRDSGAAYVTRTRDPIITNDVLYQLS